MKLIRTAPRGALEDNFHLVFQQCGIDSPLSRQAFQDILRLGETVLVSSRKTLEFYNTFSRQQATLLKTDG